MSVLSKPRTSRFHSEWAGELGEPGFAGDSPSRGLGVPSQGAPSLLPSIGIYGEPLTSGSGVCAAHRHHPQSSTERGAPGLVQRRGFLPWGGREAKPRPPPGRARLQVREERAEGRAAPAGKVGRESETQPQGLGRACGSAARRGSPQGALAGGT